MLNVSISEESAFEVAALVYSQWSQAFQKLQDVKKDTDDGSTDWALFHASQVEYAIKEERKWDKIRSETTPWITGMHKI